MLPSSGLTGKPNYSIHDNPWLLFIIVLHIAWLNFSSSQQLPPWEICFAELPLLSWQSLRNIFVQIVTNLHKNIWEQKRICSQITTLITFPEWQKYKSRNRKAKLFIVIIALQIRLKLWIQGAQKMRKKIIQKLALDLYWLSLRSTFVKIFTIFSKKMHFPPF